MSRTQFDNIDRKILSFLSANARTPFLEIARECGVSGAAIHQRVQKLVAAGIIESFQTNVSPEAIGYETCSYIGFFLTDPTGYGEVVERLKEIPEIVECHFTTGKYDLLVKLYARNNDHLLSLLHGPLQAVGAGRTETLISFKQEFRRPLSVKQED